MKVRVGFLALAVCLIAVPESSALVQKPDGKRDPRWIEPARATLTQQKIDPAESTAVGSAVRSFLLDQGGSWEFVVDRKTGMPTLIQGSGLAWVPGRGNDLDRAVLDGLPLTDGRLTIESFDVLARDLIVRHPELLHPQRGTLELDRETSLIRRDGRLASLYYRWLVDGVPVEGARVFLRVNHGNLTQFGAPGIGPLTTATTPAISAAQALELTLQHSADDELYQLQLGPELILQPEDTPPGGRSYRLIWKLVYRMPDSVENWEARVDAVTGEIVGFRDISQYARAWGGVYPRTVFESSEILVPFPNLDVNSNGAAQTTDDAGFFNHNGGPSSSGLNGDIFNTSCQGCSNPTQPSVTTAIGTGRIDFGSGGSDEIGNGFSTPADRNAFYHLTQVRRLGLKWLPALSWFNATITTNVNIANTCNAVYGGNTVNFYRSGGGCNNTGEVSDVMHHEWGHGLDGNTRGGDGASGEATADVVAIHMSHSSLIGPGFRTTGAPVRDINQFTSSRGFLSVGNIGSNCPIVGTLGPLGYEVHCEGEIYGQVAWDLAVALTAKHGEHTGWRESERIFFTSLSDAGSYLTSGPFPIYDAYVNADDDDGNLANGTPNGAEIFTAFDDHGIAGAPVGSSPPCTRPIQPALSVSESCDSFDLSWSAVAGVDHYELFRAELRVDSTFFPVGTVTAGTTNFNDAEVSPALDYHYYVMAVDAAGCESSVENPVFARLTAQPILGVTVAIDDDTPQGNRSGSADPGETVDLILTLINLGDLAAGSIAGSITTSTPGVTLLDDNAAWPAIPIGGTSTNLDPLRFDTDDAMVDCGQLLEFQFVPTDASGCAAQTSHFSVLLGVPVAALVEDFETDSGWALDPGASSTFAGGWVRGNPEGTNYQPEDDQTAGGGTDCWFTATNPGGDDGINDVDKGVTVLVSPTIDLSAFSGAELSYYRWWANSQTGVDANDYFKVDLSDDDGASWVNVETLDQNVNAPSWTERSFSLSGLISLTAEVRIRVQASDGSAVASFIEAAVDELTIEGFICDSTPACFDPPTFAGLDTAAAGSSCAETDLSWPPASSNCTNATITYSVYRSTTPGFVPDASNRIATDLTGTALNDALLVPGQTYHYIVRAYDSRSGEDGNTLELAVLSPLTPDLVAPIFSGLSTSSTGASCSQTALNWSAALESCSTPVVYEVHRSTDPAFVPDATTLVAETMALAFEDLTPAPGLNYTYIVRARDTVGNVDGNLDRSTTAAGITDQLFFEDRFEPSDGGWSVVAPNDASTGNWEWGDPEGTAYQPENDASAGGVNAWITGVAAAGGGGGNDIDGGTTTLLSASYDTIGRVDPAVRYSRWFTNDRGAAPGEDDFVIEVSDDDGASWATLEIVGAGTPLEWVAVQLPLGGVVSATNQIRFRFSAADLDAGSLVEAGIDDFALVDLDQGCTVCATPVGTVGTILMSKSANDAILDWSGDPLSADRYAVYALSGPAFGAAVRIGTTSDKTFVHLGAAAAPESFYYRVTAIDSCGNESLLD